MWFEIAALSLAGLATFGLGIGLGYTAGWKQRKRVELEREQVIQDLCAYSHMVAHDLRTPLSVIWGFSNFLREEVRTMSDADYTASLDAIESSAHKMMSIINEQMVLADERRKQVAVEPVNMPLVIHQVQKRLFWLIKSTKTELIIPETWPEVMGYAPWIEEVWTNYVSNAIKYGGRPPCVELGATVLDGRACLWVRDNGQGIEPDQLDKLFKPFVWMKPVHKIDGLGLGLSAVQRIVEKLGGEVGVESVVGQGSTFSFTLPMR